MLVQYKIATPHVMLCILDIRSPQSFQLDLWSMLRRLTHCQTMLGTGFLEAVSNGTCGASVTAVRCDTSAAEEAEAVFGPSARHVGVPPITSTVNSGGVLADAVLASQTAGIFFILRQKYLDESLIDICASWSLTRSFCPGCIRFGAP